MTEPVRCAWSLKTSLYTKYHVQEWERPVYDDRRLLFEMLVLSGAQAGLSWLTVLKKRAGYRSAFDDLAIEKVAEHGEEKLKSLLQNLAIIRNERKIISLIANARACLKVLAECPSFSDYLWQFIDHKAIVNHPKMDSDVAVVSPEAERMSHPLRQRGFSFVGPTICYAFM